MGVWNMDWKDVCSPRACKKKVDFIMAAAVMTSYARRFVYVLTRIMSNGGFSSPIGLKFSGEVCLFVKSLSSCNESGWWAGSGINGVFIFSDCVRVCCVVQCKAWNVFFLKIDHLFVYNSLEHHNVVRALEMGENVCSPRVCKKKVDFILAAAVITRF